MRIFKDFAIWLRSGTKDGQSLFWIFVALYVCYGVMLQVKHVGHVDAQSGAVLTLTLLVLGEASIGFVKWCMEQKEYPFKKECKSWSVFIRPALVLHLALGWGLAMFYGRSKPIEAVMIGLALCVYILSKTVYREIFSGKIANRVLIGSILIPFTLVAGVLKMAGF